MSCPCRRRGTSSCPSCAAPAVDVHVLPGRLLYNMRACLPPERRVTLLQASTFWMCPLAFNPSRSSSPEYSGTWILSCPPPPCRRSSPPMHGSPPEAVHQGSPWETCGAAGAAEPSNRLSKKMVLAHSPESNHLPARSRTPGIEAIPFPLLTSPFAPRTAQRFFEK